MRPPDADAARSRLPSVVDQLVPDAPIVADRLQDMGTDLLADTAFHAGQRSTIWSNHPIERLLRQLERLTAASRSCSDTASAIPRRSTPGPRSTTR